MHRGNETDMQVVLLKNHSHHNKEFLAIDEVRKASINELRYWPFDQKYRSMFDFIRQHDSYLENLLQDIKSTFEVSSLLVKNFLISAMKAIKEA